MEEPNEEELSEYLDYVASHIITLSDFIKNNNVENKKIIQQHLDEMAESIKSVLFIVDKEGNLNKGIDNSTIKIIRDFKIRKIMDGRNK